MKNNTQDAEKLYVVEVGGYFFIQDTPELGGLNVLDAEDVGYENAHKIAHAIVEAYNRQKQTNLHEKPNPKDIYNRWTAELNKK
jgi:hypothetical protein